MMMNMKMKEKLYIHINLINDMMLVHTYICFVQKNKCNT